MGPEGSMLETVKRRGFANAGTRRFDREGLIRLLGEDLDFHDQASGYASHNFHSFPAKFPPQLPRKFISALTDPGDIVLDPMMGSGTTVVEAYLAGRQAIGIDIDPLAVLISRVKTTPASVQQIADVGDMITLQSRIAVDKGRAELGKALETRWDAKTKEFIDNWFAPETQLELLALLEQINNVSDADVRNFFVLALSSIIITKSGGVSLALDLGHTRPHRARVVLDRAGKVIVGKDYHGARKEGVDCKTVGSPIDEFKRRFCKNLSGLVASNEGRIVPLLAFGNAQSLPIGNSSVSLIVTSPPYASNAIDYMRAHKFSLVWLGHALGELSDRRREYIGGEAVRDESLESLPPGASAIVDGIGNLDRAKGRVLHRYFSEMTRSLREMFRVLGPGRIAVVVVGASVMRGKDTETANCLAEIGKAIGFDVPRIGVRALDRDRRMLPVGNKRDTVSQIQNRMHEEYVIGFLKPESQGRLL